MELHRSLISSAGVAPRPGCGEFFVVEYDDVVDSATIDTIERSLSVLPGLHPG
jgi:hypothetical protein